MHRQICCRVTQSLPPVAQKLQGWLFQELCKTRVGSIRHFCRLDDMLLCTASPSNRSAIDKCIHSSYMRRDQLAPSQARYSRPSQFTGFERHLLHKFCVAIISSTTYATKMFFYSQLLRQNRQVRKSCVEIFPPQIRRRRPAHPAKNALIHHCSANFALRFSGVASSTLL